MKDIDTTQHGEQYLLALMTSEDVSFLRSACLEMIVVTGHLYRRIQIQTLLHPLFFLGGFFACYYFMK
jgi:hypothetical protein